MISSMARRHGGGGSGMAVQCSNASAAVAATAAEGRGPNGHTSPPTRAIHPIPALPANLYPKARKKQPRGDNDEELGR